MNAKSILYKVLIAIAVLGIFTATGALAQEDRVTGTVYETEEGIVLKTRSGVKLAVSGEDLTDLVGKSVIATGIIVEDVTGGVINVTTVEVIEEE